MAEDAISMLRKGNPGFLFCTNDSKNDENHKGSSNDTEYTHLENGTPAIDQILSKAGFQGFHYCIFFCFGFFIFAEGFYLTLIPSTMIPFKEYYQVDDLLVCFITSFLFISFGVASLITPYFSSKLSRKTILTIAAIVHIPFGMALSSFQRLEIFMLSILVIGFSLGLSVPLLNNSLAEILPINNRAFALIFVWIFFVFAQLFYPISMTFLMPKLESSNLPDVFKLGTTVISILLILTLLLFEDSPRNLLIIQQYDQAFNILESLLKQKLSQRTKRVLIESSKSDVLNQNTKEPIENVEANLQENNNQNAMQDSQYESCPIENNGKSIIKQLTKIFDRDKYLVLTLITATLWCINAIIFYGPSLILTLTIQKIDNMDNPDEISESISRYSTDVFKTLYFYSTASLFCLLLSAVMAELTFFGRKNTLICSYAISTFISALIIIFPHSFKILIGILSLFASVGFNVIGSFSSELFSTDVRDSAIGFFFFCNRIGAVSSQFVFLVLFNIYYLLPYILLTFLTLAATLLSVLYPFDTLGKPLDTIH